jgi:hypothetical protein
MPKFCLYRWLATDAVSTLWLLLHAHLQTEINFNDADIASNKRSHLHFFHKIFVIITTFAVARVKTVH